MEADNSKTQEGIRKHDLECECKISLCTGFFSKLQNMFDLPSMSDV